MLQRIGGFAAALPERVITSANRLPFNEVGLVLGTSKFSSDGVSSNPFFEGRLNTAARLYHAGKVHHLLVSGDNGRKNYDEPTWMRDALIARGVPKEAITLDYAGFRTLDSMARAKEVFGLTSFTIITDDFHQPRAVFLARSRGLDGVGFPSDHVPWIWSKKTRIRELASASSPISMSMCSTQTRAISARAWRSAPRRSYRMRNRTGRTDSVYRSYGGLQALPRDPVTSGTICSFTCSRNCLSPLPFPRDLRVFQSVSSQHRSSRSASFPIRRAKTRFVSRLAPVFGRMKFFRPFARVERELGAHHFQVRIAHLNQGRQSRSEPTPPVLPVAARGRLSLLLRISRSGRSQDSPPVRRVADPCHESEPRHPPWGGRARNSLMPFGQAGNRSVDCPHLQILYNRRFAARLDVRPSSATRSIS